MVTILGHTAEIYLYPLARQRAGDEHPRAVMVGNAITAGAERLYANFASHGVEL